MRTYLIGFIMMCFFGKAQKNNFNLVLGYGPSYFFNDNTLHRHIDHTRLIGINYVLHTKSKSFSFNPGINIQSNAYHARLRQNTLVHVNQKTFSLNLDVLMKINKRQLVRVGLLLNLVDHSNIFVTTTQYNGRNYYSFGSDQMYKGYIPTDLQAGVTLGVCFPFKLFNREQTFDIKVVQFASSLVNTDYIMSKDITGEEIKVLSTRARPTILVVVWAISLKRNKKEKKVGEE